MGFWSWRAPIAVGLLFLSCKENGPKSNASLSSDASAVATSSEILLSENSTPEPMPSPKQTADDLNENLHSLNAESFPRADIGKYQIAGSDLTGTPKELQGIWWMDGNPLSDETVSFAKVDFSQAKPLLPVFGLNNFSWHSGNGPSVESPEGDPELRKGMFAFSLAQAVSLVYEFDFSGTPNKYEFARIIPTLKTKIGLVEKRLRVSPKVMEFTMIRKGPHLYSRDNTFFGKPIPNYFFRRILVPSAADPKVLDKTEWWPLYEKQAIPVKLRMTVRNP